MPFASRLDVKIPWLFYAVPSTRPGGINTVFTDRFYDDRENWIPPGVGVVPNSMRPYLGAIPDIDAPMSPIIGSPDEWVNGLDYDQWQSGGSPTTPCWPISEFLLLENRRLLLQENNGRLELQYNPVPPDHDFLLLESLGLLTQENGSRLEMFD